MNSGEFMRASGEKYELQGFFVTIKKVLQTSTTVSELQGNSTNLREFPRTSGKFWYDLGLMTRPPVLPLCTAMANASDYKDELRAKSRGRLICFNTTNVEALIDRATRLGLTGTHLVQILMIGFFLVLPLLTSACRGLHLLRT